MAKKIQQELTAQTVNVNCAPVDLQDFKAFSVQITVSNGDSFNGTCILQISNDFDAWIDIPSSSQSLSGTDDVQIYDVIDSAVAWVRVKLIISSGSADFDIDYMLKP